MQPDIVAEAVNPALKELETVWDYIGYSSDERTSRLRQLADALRDRAVDFVAEENARREELDSRVESRKRACAAISRSLRLPPYLPPRDLPTLELLRRLEEHAEQFGEQIRRRRSEFFESVAEADRLRRLLELPPEPTVEGAESEEFVPTAQQLESQLQSLQSLRDQQQSAASTAASLREDIRRIAADIEYLPETDFETVVLNPETKVETLVVSERAVGELQAWRLRLVKHKAMLVGTCDELRQHVSEMWQRLGIPQREQAAFLSSHSGYRPSTLEALQDESDKCQQLKWAQLPAYLAGLRREAERLADCCFEEDQFAPVEAEDEEAAAELERRVERLRAKLTANRELYEAVQQYQATWTAFLEAEQRLKDPAIFSNRGGILLKTEKERKQLAKELPKVEAKVSEQLQRLDADGSFRIGGRTFSEHVQHLWDEFNEEKEAAKVSRKLTRGLTGEDGRQVSHSRESSVNPPASPRRSTAGKR